jgi:hypothetical protein
MSKHVSLNIKGQNINSLLILIPSFLLRLLHSNKKNFWARCSSSCRSIQNSWIGQTLQQVPSRDPSVIKLAFYKSIKSSYCEQICWQILDFLISCSLDVFICAL